MNYINAIKKLTSEKVFKIDLSLDRMYSALDKLGNPQDSLKYIHVAGTNGKGSTCAMLASILEEVGYKIGLYTSPHIFEYTERIKINGKEIDKEEFAKLIEEILSGTFKAIEFFFSSSCFISSSNINLNPIFSETKVQRISFI